MSAAVGVLRHALVCLALAGSAQAAGAAVPADAGYLPEQVRAAATAAAVQLGAVDGFAGNSEVRVALPGKLAKAAKLLGRVGLREQADGLVLAMNRAAEAAMPEAGSLLAAAIGGIAPATFAVLHDGEPALAVAALRDAVGESLAAQLQPAIAQRMATDDVARRYGELSDKASALGLIDPERIALEAYVTREALDGLFLATVQQLRSRTR